MKTPYCELITTVSDEIVKTLLDTENNLATRARLLDADIAEITRQIGLETTKKVFEHVRDDLVKKKQDEGLVIQKSPVICFNTIFGPITLRSPYLWKKYDGSTPLREFMNITHHGRSEAVNRALSDFGSEESFRQAAKRFHEHYKYILHDSTVSRVTKQIADDALNYVEHRFSHAEDQSREEGTACSPVKQMLVELDGCEIRTAVLVPVTETQDAPSEADTPQKTQDASSEADTPKKTQDAPSEADTPKKQKLINWRDVRIGLARPLESKSSLYVGQKESYPDVVSDLVQAAVLQGMSSTTDVIGVADGGIGLREELERQFSGMQFILDYPHLKDHFYETAEALGLSPQERKAWVTPHLDAIWEGNVDSVMQELAKDYATHPQDRLRRLLGYLERFSDAVDYKRFTEQGYPIGSGEIESAHKAIPQKRLKLPGACWHPDSVNPMIALRILRANEWWDDFWKEHTEQQLAA